MPRTTVVAILSVLLLAGCGGSDDDPEAERSPTPEPTATTATPPPTPTGPDTFELGSPLSANVLNATLLEYRRAVDSMPREGTRADAAHVRMCNTGVNAGEGGEYIFSPLSWEFRDDDEGIYDDKFLSSVPTMPKPELGYDRELAIDECIKGWIYLSVPEAVTITSVAFKPDSQVLGVWEVDAS